MKSQKSYDGSNALYLIPTPIGNLEDITLRAIHILEQVDFLLCEDTRVTDQLLKHLKIRKRLISCHEHNEERVKTMVLEELKTGKMIGLVTDRGTPVISDPGYRIVKTVVENGYHVIGLPGPTAFVPALIASGIDATHFLFYGFLNAKGSKRKKELEFLKRYPYTMLFYEAPHRVLETLRAMQEVFGDRKISVSREISKLYEEIYRGQISEMISVSESMRGEIVLVVEGDHTLEDYTSLSVVEHVRLYVEDGISEKEAIKKVAEERNVPKSLIYKEYHSGK